MHHFNPDPFLSPPASPRHAVLFELIRQRDMAQAINRRIARAAEPDPADLSHLAMIAARSLGVTDQSPARI